ncbi:hypothetical protein DAY19_02585 [Halobacteriovorax vibrionivorans]|uniref:Uncharacterized protein n=1 Tax=Halobacteriovorax vibrionivorans TaxID=2152716 RepID=A0ABY0IJ77_9BACT|nr:MULTISPECIES: hypothetical protein [Halobacteriovorax]RZF22677.1 hypothetical protein DAY19_02585 [Halobacteriovorax vibrionivorans]TGD46698.1 hypothetical protein EP118_10970 [Halobacteriovorax sp. Y22]
MKKSWPLLIVLFYTSAFANTIVPEISRDGKTLNRSALAVAFEKRNYVGGEIHDGDYQGENIQLFGGAFVDQFSFQADVDFDDDLLDDDRYDVKAGYRFASNMALALGVAATDFVDDPSIEVGLSTISNNLIIAGSFTANIRDNADDNYTLTAGLGQDEKSLSWEAGIRYDLNDNDDDLLGLFAGATRVVNNVELDGDIEFKTRDEFTEIDLNLDAEFLVHKEFYVTPGVFFNYREVGNNDDDYLGVSGDFGYRANQVDATAGLDYVISDNDRRDGIQWKINAAYFF